MAGHNKWSKIKRKKGVADARRSKVWARITRDILVAAREGGGSVDMNPRLALAVDKAKAENMPKDNIERAIKRGTGEIEGADYEEGTMDAERDRVLAAASVLGQGGYLTPEMAELSVGSTPGATHFTNAEHDGFQITEIRPGTYVFFDAGQVALGAARLQDCALVCVGTVISKRRFDDGTERDIVDAGKKILTSDVRAGHDGFGTVLYSPRTMVVNPHTHVVALSEEHGWVDTPGASIYDVGDPVFIVPNHVCVAVATRRELFVVDGDEVVETWQTVAR